MSGPHRIGHRGNPWPLVEEPSRPAWVVASALAAVALIVIVGALAPVWGAR